MWQIIDISIEIRKGSVILAAFLLHVLSYNHFDTWMVCLAANDRYLSINSRNSTFPSIYSIKYICTQFTHLTICLAINPRQHNTIISSTYLFFIRVGLGTLDFTLRIVYATRTRAHTKIRDIIINKIENYDSKKTRKANKSKNRYGQ